MNYYNTKRRDGNAGKKAKKSVKKKTAKRRRNKSYET